MKQHMPTQEQLRAKIAADPDNAEVEVRPAHDNIWLQRSAESTDLPRIVPEQGDRCAVYGADPEPVHVAEDYPSAHRWAMNRWNLTSTQMLPVYAAYAELLPPEAEEERSEPAPPAAAPAPAAQPNKYRKPAA